MNREDELPDAAASLTPYPVPAATVGTAAIAAYTASNWKVRKVRLTYAQRIRDTCLENSRKVAGDVYVPLLTAISALTRVFREFRNCIDFDQSSAPPGGINRFEGSCNHFTDLVARLLAGGASAYPTLPPEEELTDFVPFPEASLLTDIATKSRPFTLILWNVHFTRFFQRRAIIFADGRCHASHRRGDCTYFAVSSYSAECSRANHLEPASFQKV